MSALCQRKRGGITPITVVGWRFKSRDRPTIFGSPPNVLCQVLWLKTATGGAPGAASAGVNVRPIKGGTPST